MTDRVIINMEVSGCTFIVGWSEAADPKESSVWIKTDGDPEGSYLSAAESRLLRAALEVAEQEIRG